MAKIDGAAAGVLAMLGVLPMHVTSKAALSSFLFSIDVHIMFIRFVL